MNLNIFPINTKKSNLMHKIHSTETTEVDFKLEVELRKPKSWLKSVSAFANGIGGTLLFGVDDAGQVIGLNNIQEKADRISELIKTKIDPVPEFILTSKTIDEKEILNLDVHSGHNTPYYYSNDGNSIAYIRIGNESVQTTAPMLNELILKGKNQTFDSLPSSHLKSDFSFTLFEATYRQQTNNRIEPKDYYSFGLTTTDNHLSNTGLLLADQCALRHSRLFCTRWNGLSKGSIFDDAVDDKEFDGNLIYLLQSGTNPPLTVGY
jgi:ATP-dependent DNA helicase RecG